MTFGRINAMGGAIVMTMLAAAAVWFGVPYTAVTYRNPTGPVA